MPQTVWVLLVFLPTGAGEIAANNAFNRERLGFFDDHAAALELRLEGLQHGRERVLGAGDEVIFNDGLEAIEPEKGDLREDFAFAGYAVGKDAVEGGNPVGGNHQEPVTKVEEFTHLAAAQFADAGQVQLQNWFVCHAQSMAWVRENSTEFCGEFPWK